MPRPDLPKTVVSHLMKTLILIPTEFERVRLRESLGDLREHDARMELCGFGVVASAARTASLFSAALFDHVVLVGIAGAIDPQLRVGTAYCFAEVACHGIGAGEGPGFISAGAMGWPLWPGDPPSESQEIGDVLPCHVMAGEGVCGEDGVAGAVGCAGQLLTVCAASGSDAEVATRRSLFPNAVAEDMEGFGVAVACRMAGVPLGIIRGISNLAGNRDVACWRIPEALAAAGRLTRDYLKDLA